MQEIARDLPRGIPRMRAAELPFAEIPHQSKLFLGYLADPLALTRFYPNAAVSPLDLVGQTAAVLEGYTVDRLALCDALAETNSNAGSGTRACENIDALREDGCVAILTGQQAGLFSGPLYTVYKALSAVRTAQVLSERGVRAVPIFWAATEDHDFDEVSVVTTVGADGSVVDINYEADPAFSMREVGDVVINDQILSAIDKLFEQMPATEFTVALRNDVASAWVPGTRWGHAFLKTLASLFQNCGLILADPMHPGLKKLAAPIYAAAVTKTGEITAALRSRDSALKDAGYHSQVLIGDDYVPFFWIDDEGKRTALRMRGDGTVGLKGAKGGFTSEELSSIAADTPERLSPGVMLRPVVQDYLFPTLCYFGGGAEVAYFAQNSEVYRVLGRRATPIFHRQSFTIIEPKQRRVLSRYEISLTDLFDGREKLGMRLAAREDMRDNGKVFSDVEQKISAELDHLDREISAIDNTVSANLATRRKKIVYHIGALRDKTLRALARKNGERARQLDSLFSSVLPKGGLQERSINVLTYLNKYGPNFIDWVYRSIDIERKGHTVLDI